MDLISLELRQSALHITNLWLEVPRRLSACCHVRCWTVLARRVDGFLVDLHRRQVRFVVPPLLVLVELRFGLGHLPRRHHHVGRSEVRLAFAWKRWPGSPLLEVAAHVLHHLFAAVTATLPQLLQGQADGHRRLPLAFCGDLADLCDCMPVSIVELRIRFLLAACVRPLGPPTILWRGRQVGVESDTVAEYIYIWVPSPEQEVVLGPLFALLSAYISAKWGRLVPLHL